MKPSSAAINAANSTATSVVPRSVVERVYSGNRMPLLAPGTSEALRFSAGLEERSGAKLRHSCRRPRLPRSWSSYGNNASPIEPDGSILHRLLRISCWFRSTILWFIRGRTHPGAAFEWPSAQGRFDAVDQDGSSERLGQEADSSSLQRPSADACIGESRNEDERRFVTHGAHPRQKLQAAHTRHLHIGNDTQGLAKVVRLQELLGRHEGVDQVSVRAEKIVGRGANGCVVVND